MTDRSKRDITPEQALQICRVEAPYPLNYLPSGDDQQKAMGVIIGYMIHKEIFTIGWPKERRYAR